MGTEQGPVMRKFVLLRVWWHGLDPSDSISRHQEIEIALSFV